MAGSEPKDARALHADLMQLWKSYQDLSRQIHTSAQTLGELRNKADELGQQLYALYQQSNDGLDGEQSKGIKL